MAVVKLFRSRSSRDPDLMQLLRCLHFLAARYDISLAALQIRGVDNTAADALSRNDLTFLFLLSPGPPTSVLSAAGAVRVSGVSPARLALTRLEAQAAEYLKNGIASSTWKTYSSAQSIYIEFCGRLGFSLLPATEGSLILFVTELAQTRAHSTIRTYLSSVRHLHILHGFPNPLVYTPRLELVLKGIQHMKPRQGKPRLPITPLILKSILDQSSGYDSTMLWAVCCLAFFGFLRCGEFTVTAGTLFDAAKHLAFQDISVNSHVDPTLLADRIKASKMDQFGKVSWGRPHPPYALWWQS